MSLILRVILASEMEEIAEYEKKKMNEVIADEMERELASWNARWRRESLEHYLPMGWSFLARDRSQILNSSDGKSESTEGALVGYFIAQPLLFFQGQTQSLWVEHVQYSSLQARDELTDLAYRLCREKHFQSLILPQTTSLLNSVKHLKPLPWGEHNLTIKTSK